MATLQFENQTLVLEKDPSSPPADLSPYEHGVLNFCRAYLGGKKYFNIKTSGSTGAPKVITISRKQMEISARATIEALDLKPRCQMLVCINTDYIGGKMMLVRGMALNATLIIREPDANPSRSVEDPIDFMALVPLQVNTLLASPAGQEFLRKCTTVIVGGAPLSPFDRYKLRDFPNHIYQTFGMTETVSHIALKKLSQQEADGPFRTLPEVVINQDERECLMVTGPVTNHQQVVTNDVIELVDHKSFHWLGRYDQIINSGGFKVYPPRVEVAVHGGLRQMEWVCDFAVLGIPHEKLGEMVTLVLETDQQSALQIEQLLAYLKEQLHPYEVPKKVATQMPLPRTENGKIKLKDLQRRLATRKKI